MMAITVATVRILAPFKNDNENQGHCLAAIFISYHSALISVELIALDHVSDTLLELSA